MENLPLNELRNIFKKELNHIPDFLDGNQFLIWSNIRQLNLLILKFVKSEYTTDYDLKYTKKMFKNTTDILEDEICYEMIEHYFAEMLAYMIEGCVYHEHFEAAFNLKKFADDYMNRRVQYVYIDK